MPWADDFIKWSGWGATAVLAALRMYESWRDRQPRVKVTARHGLTLPELGGKLICVSATNIGRRPVTIQGVSFELRSGQHHIQPLPGGMLQTSTRLPCKLEEGDTWNVHLDYDAIRDLEQQSGEEIVAASVRDAAGREYKRRFRLQ